MATRPKPEIVNIDNFSDVARVNEAVVRGLYGGISYATLIRRIRAGDIPRPVKDGGHTNYWVVGPLRAALAAASA